MSKTIIIQPFTAASLERLSEKDRNAKLTRLGLRFLKANKLMAWDGKDTARALDLASIPYKRTLWQIASASLRSALIGEAA